MMAKKFSFDLFYAHHLQDQLHEIYLCLCLTGNKTPIDLKINMFRLQNQVFYNMPIRRYIFKCFVCRIKCFIIKLHLDYKYVCMQNQVFCKIHIK